ILASVGAVCTQSVMLRSSMVLIRDTRCLLGLFDLVESFIYGRDVGDGVTYEPRLLNATRINKQSGAEGDVLGSMAGGVKQTVLADDLSSRIAQDHDLPLRGLVPNVLGMLLVIHTDGHYLHTLLKIGSSLRQTAQLRHAVRSPVATVEIQQDPRSTLFGERKVVAILILQAEVRGGLAGCRCSQGLGI